MNHIYRLVWNHISNAWVCCAENAKGRGKSGSGGKSAVVGAVALAAGALASSMALAAPSGGQVSAGSASIAQTGLNTTITQTSQNLAINWQSFSIAANEAVRFAQPNASSVALNRVIGQDPSQILGSLSANGQVFVLNPNGVLFGASAQVNVGGLVASTLGLSDTDLMAGRYIFSSGTGGQGSVLNQGSLSAAQGGYIALLAPEVRNEGVITATLGTALLAAGNKVTLNLNNGSLLGYSIDQGALRALAENRQLIQADGGQVFMSAKAADELSTAVVNNTGIVQARTVHNVAGVIRLMGDMDHGTVNVGGTLDASAPEGGNGGFIETSAAHVKVASGTRVTTQAAQGLSGSWLIDPADFTIAASGGDISGTDLGHSLDSGSVIIRSASDTSPGNGDIFVRDNVSWSAATKLTLSAERNINILAAITASNSAGQVALEYGQGALAAGNAASYTFGLTGTGFTGSINLQAGNNFSTKLGSDGALKNYTVITSLGSEGSTSGADLQGMNGNLAGNYVLGADIDATGTSGWNSDGAVRPTYEGFTPIGTSSANFTGHFDGLGHTISQLTINRPTTTYVGLFGGTGGAAAIRNVGLVDASVIGRDHVGALVGYSTGDISNSYVTGNVNGGGDYIGGLVGYSTGDISNSYVTGNVSWGSYYVGGLVGYSTGDISNSYATGNVSGALFIIGGLVGANMGTISSSYATGAVSGNNTVGGLVGGNWGRISDSYATGAVSGGGAGGGGLVGYNNYGGTIYGSYATGNVSGTNDGVGGLAGANYGTISSSYATGAVSGTSNVGGLVGRNSGDSSISNSYATGNVNGTGDYVGGLVGANYGALSDSYATGVVSGGNEVGGLVGANYGAISNSYVTGIVSGSNDVGGLVGLNSGGTVSNSYATVAVSGSSYVGGLVGYADYRGTIHGSYATGVVNASGHFVGGLVGRNDGTLRDSYATGDVSGGSNVGGLVGRNDGGTVSNSYATGAVSGSSYVGGLVGANSGAISSSYATGNVNGTGDYVGGLVGVNYGTINNSYATGAVSGRGRVGGLVGANSFSGAIYGSYAMGTVDALDGFIGGLVGHNAGTISNSYASGNVSSTGFEVGGLVGFNDFQGTISNSYATGAVSGGSNVGGLVGSNNGGTVSNSFWDMDTSHQSSSAGGTGLSSAQMKMLANFTSATAANGGSNPAWDFASTWVMYEGQTSPLLRSFMTQLTVTVNDASKTYDGQAYAGSAGVTYSITPDQSKLLGSLSYSSAGGTTNAGSRALAAGGLYSGQQGYLIRYVDGTLTITPALLRLSGSSASSKTYDATNVASVTPGTLYGFVGNETVSVAGSSATFSDKNVGDNKSVVANYILADGSNGGLASNYYLAPESLSASIVKRDLQVTGLSANDKVYDGSTAAALSGTAMVAAISGDSVTLGGTASGVFASQAIGTDIAVAVHGNTLSGLDAGNYNLVEPNDLKANITEGNDASSQSNAVTAQYVAFADEGHKNDRPQIQIESLAVIGDGLRLPDGVAPYAASNPILPIAN